MVSAPTDVYCIVQSAAVSPQEDGGGIPGYGRLFVVEESIPDKIIIVVVDKKKVVGLEKKLFLGG